jgi:Aldo/keto reductase family
VHGSAGQGQVEGLEGQFQVADFGVLEPLDAVVVDQYIVRGPHAAKLGAEGGQLADEFGRYSTADPLPEGSSRAGVYNGVLPQLQALTDRMRALGEDRGACAPDVATAWAIAKGTTPIIGVTKADYIDGLVRARGIELAEEEIAELEALADAADVDRRGWWENEM